MHHADESADNAANWERPPRDRARSLRGGCMKGLARRASSVTLASLVAVGGVPAHGQSNRISTGMTKAVYQSCLGVSDLRGVAAMSVFPDALIEKVFGEGSDPLNMLQLKCASQLRDNRCTKAMLSALGDTYLDILKGQAGLAKMPNIPTSVSDPAALGTMAGAVVVGGAGAVFGDPLFHSRVIGAAGGAVVGGMVGNAVGGAIGSYAPLVQCKYRQRSLNSIASKLSSPASAMFQPLPITADNVQLTLDENVQAGNLDVQQANELRTEIALVTARLREIMVVIQS